MSAETTTGATMASDSSQRASFFRQSGWLMIGNVAGGALMYAVHFFSKVIPQAEYAIFGALVALTILVPAMPLQMVIAQQAASSLALGRRHQLAGIFRAAWASVTGVWLIAFVLMLLWQSQLMTQWGITNPAALWVTMFVILLQAWLPMFQGLVQGQQNFMPFGWSLILNGVGRLGVCVLVLLVLTYKEATGLMIGALGGFALATAICMWSSRGIWTAKSEAYEFRGLVVQVLPLFIGFGSCQFLMAADTLIVKAYIPQDVECYVAAGTLSRALVWAVGPLTSVMFPRIVASSVRGEKSNVFALTLGLTAVIAIVGVLGLWICGPWVVRLMATPAYVAKTTELLPWYAGAMVPLCLANMLASNLLGKGEYKVVIPMVLLAIGYAVTLLFVHSSFMQVLQLLALFNFLLFAVCAWFTFRPRKSEPQTPAATPA